MKHLDFKDKFLRIDDKELEMEFSIKDARIIDNKAIVIFDFNDLVPKHRQFNNCRAFDNNGDLIWIAEHPTNTSADFYVEFMDSKSNKLWNFSCFICQLDYKTGRLIKSEFTK
ncbi:hypothetical protein [uncultured Acetobacteroides sp.]|uniref:hypothetical protein n=1 Tax=uncultured Acetobacteroides sp. TaxID=1760811 RepID=UPI0029F4CFAC|nr:hypothetical protein [uncultured Acetobacteroides sp.]